MDRDREKEMDKWRGRDKKVRGRDGRTDGQGGRGKMGAEGRMDEQIRG